jgi:hypothetical protein
MRILLDECVPVQIRHALPEYEVTTTQRMGWAGIGNGDLLQRAEEAGFDLFIIADQNLRYQQNLAVRRIAILELWTNHRPTLERHFDRIHLAASHVTSGAYVVLSAIP